MCIRYMEYILWNKMDYRLDSDMSSELILGNVLSKEHGILTDKWMYSTELCVLNIQLIYQMLFLFTNNWHIVRCVSSILSFVILFLCFYYLMCQLGFKKSILFIIQKYIITILQKHRRNYLMEKLRCGQHLVQRNFKKRK